MKRTSEIRFHFTEGQHEIEGVVVNPGEWFGQVWILQIAIANALNPFYAIEAEHEQDAIDAFADSRFSHLIDVPEDDIPRSAEAEDNSGYTTAGNDGHRVDLSNCHIRKAPERLEYRLAWKPNDTGMSAQVDELLDPIRKEEAEEREHQRIEAELNANDPHYG